jgi:hypothetical protein
MAKLDPKIKRLLSGMLTKKMPDSEIEWVDEQEFTVDGTPIPISERMLALEAIPKNMEGPKEKREMTDDEVHEAARIGELIKKEIQNMLKGLGDKEDKKDKEDKEEGMFTSNKEKEIAKGTEQTNITSKKEEFSKDVAKDLSDEGRGLKGYKPPVGKIKDGWKKIEGSNALTVDEKHNHWKTQKGYDEAMKMYGTKPAWVKQPSLLYNPKTKEYDPIKKEEYVDLKPTKRISL